MTQGAQSTPRRARSPRGSGDQLRAEIVAAARSLMAEAPTAEAVSIRAVAAAVGVTAPSIYRHFADKQELITAVVVDVFEDLDEAMLAAAEGIDDPLERLFEFGLTYVRFALEHPDHYRLATMDLCPRPDVESILAEGAWVHFNSVVQECLNAGVFAGDGDDPALAITLDLWTAAHGLAAMFIVKPHLPWGDPDAVARRVLTAAAYGHTIRPGTWP